MRKLNQFAFVLLAAGMLAACSSTVKNRNPLGEPFPGVQGKSLAGEVHQIPQDFAGEPVLLLIGYVMDTQFDIDRWLLGLMQAEISVAAYEIPTIRSLAARPFAGRIDSGMRGGIPQEDWRNVITVYGDAGKIVSFLGNERPRNTRAVLLDAEGRVAWFHDAGYSPRLMFELQDTIESMKARP